MGINSKILDRLVSECKQDVELRTNILLLLEIENDGVTNFKDKYRSVIESNSIEDTDNED